MSGWCHMIFFSFVMGTASVISANSLNWHMLWSTRVYYWEQTTWRSTLEQRKFCDVAVAQSLQTEEAGLVQPACQMVFYTWEPCAKLPLVNILKNVCAFKIYLAGDWTNHLYTNIYHGLTSTNHTVGECYHQLHQVSWEKSKNVLSVPLLALPLMKYTLQFWYTCNWCYRRLANLLRSCHLCFLMNSHFFCRTLTTI